MTTKKTKMSRKKKTKWQKLSEERIKARQKQKRENHSKFVKKVAKRRGYEDLNIVIQLNKKEGERKPDTFCCEPVPEALEKVIENRKLANFAGVEGYLFEPWELGDLLREAGDKDWGDESHGKDENITCCDDSRLAVLVTPEFLKKFLPKKKSKN